MSRTSPRHVTLDRHCPGPATYDVKFQESASPRYTIRPRFTVRSSRNEEICDKFYTIKSEFETRQGEKGFSFGSKYKHLDI